MGNHGTGINLKEGEVSWSSAPHLALANWIRVLCLAVNLYTTQGGRERGKEKYITWRWILKYMYISLSITSFISKILDSENRIWEASFRIQCSAWQRKGWEWSVISLRTSSQVIECNCVIFYPTKLVCNFCIPSKNSVKPGGLPGQNHHLIGPFQILGFKSFVKSDEI